MIEHPILGAWFLHEWRIDIPDRATQYPFGKDPHGRLLYTPDGQMLAAIARGDRKPLGSDNPRAAGSEDKVAAFESFFCYGGRFAIEAGDVVHHVDIALNPGFVGTLQRRHMALSDAELVLSASEESAKGTRHHRLHWKREIA